MFERYRWMIVVPLLATLGACSAVRPPRDPMGSLLPDVVGRGTGDRPVALPGACAGDAAILLVGYSMASQFDLDQWLSGLHDRGIDVPVVELPMAAIVRTRLASTPSADNTQSATPREDWALVIRLTADDATRLTRFLGTGNPVPARVVLIDAHGRVAFFHDGGYDIDALLDLSDVIDALNAEMLDTTALEPFE